MTMLRNVLLLFIIFSMGNAEVELAVKCPPGWKNFGVRCYKYFSQSVNWITAERNCQSLGANLASVHSKLENDFLLSLVPSSTLAWVGAHDGEQINEGLTVWNGMREGQWLWSDGTAYDYTNWCSNEPNSANGAENCLEINWTSNRCWNDGSCSVSNKYVCVTNM